MKLYLSSNFVLTYPYGMEGRSIDITDKHINGYGNNVMLLSHRIYLPGHEDVYRNEDQ